jgi:hypothetical protein
MFRYVVNEGCFVSSLQFVFCDAGMEPTIDVMHTTVIIRVYEIKRNRLCCHVFVPHPGVSLYSVAAFQDDIGLAINEQPWFAVFCNPLKYSGNAYVPRVNIRNFFLFPKTVRTSAGYVTF